MSALTGMPGGGGILSAAIEHAGNPAEPIEAYRLVRRLIELYPNRLHLEFAFHGNAAEKLVNRGLIAIAQRMELPLVATNAVRFARPDDALADKVLEAIGRGTMADGVLGHNGRGANDLPTLTVEAVRAQAYLKTPKQMWRAFGQMPSAVGPGSLLRSFDGARIARSTTAVLSSSVRDYGLFGSCPFLL